MSSAKWLLYLQVSIFIDKFVTGSDPCQKDTNFNCGSVSSFHKTTAEMSFVKHDFIAQNIFLILQLLPFVSDDGSFKHLNFAV